MEFDVMIGTIIFTAIIVGVSVWEGYKKGYIYFSGRKNR